MADTLVLMEREGQKSQMQPCEGECSSKEVEAVGQASPLEEGSFKMLPSEVSLTEGFSLAESFILPNLTSSNALASFPCYTGKLALGTGLAASLSHVGFSRISGPVFLSPGCTLELSEL